MCGVRCRCCSLVLVGRIPLYSVIGDCAQSLASLGLQIDDRRFLTTVVWVDNIFTISKNATRATKILLLIELELIERNGTLNTAQIQKDPSDHRASGICG